MLICQRILSITNTSPFALIWHCQEQHASTDEHDEDDNDDDDNDDYLMRMKLRLCSYASASSTSPTVIMIIMSTNDNALSSFPFPLAALYFLSTTLPVRLALADKGSADFLGQPLTAGLTPSLGCLSRKSDTFWWETGGNPPISRETERTPPSPQTHAHTHACTPVRTPARDHRPARTRTYTHTHTKARGCRRFLEQSWW